MQARKLSSRCFIKCFITLSISKSLRLVLRFVRVHYHSSIIYLYRVLLLAHLSVWSRARGTVIIGAGPEPTWPHNHSDT